MRYFQIIAAAMNEATKAVPNYRAPKAAPIHTKPYTDLLSALGDDDEEYS